MGLLVEGIGRRRGNGGDIPIVALPPIFIRPKRRKGTERVVTFGTMSRITITSSGFWGTSLADIFALMIFCWCLILCCAVERGLSYEATEYFIDEVAESSMMQWLQLDRRTLILFRDSTVERIEMVLVLCMLQKFTERKLQHIYTILRSCDKAPAGRHSSTCICIPYLAALKTQIIQPDVFTQHPTA